MSELPSGTVSFIFTDIEGSTQLWESRREEMAEALAAHDAVLRAAVAAHDGWVFSTGGDGFTAAFQRAPDAVAAALAIQLGLTAESLAVPISVRIGLHTGDVQERDANYFGPPLNRCARLMGAAHGGQVLLSGVTATLAGDRLPGGSSLRDLGEHRLRDLSEPEHVFQLLHPDLRAEFPPLRSLDAYPGNLPVQPTGFVGREAELAEISKALEECRVVTLCGVGGVGKTRLALQVAADVIPRFGDGSWFVELGPVDRPDAFDAAVAAALEVQQRPGTTMLQTVLDFVREKSLLLVLDNCEHLLGEAARFADAAVRAAPGLRVLATSREGLAVPGERVVTVPSLELPASDLSAAGMLETEAVRLFVSRARDSDSAFSGGLDDAPAMAELCRRLDGIPLAIELAAARVRGMTPTEITEHLDRRFKLLTRGRRTATTRHQTLRNTIDWSYDLLDDQERTVFRRLAVFAGDFGPEAAEAVVAGDDLDPFEVLDLLLRLVEKSLIVAEGHAAVTRYRLLETMRDYASERLAESGELEAVGGRHARYFVELALRAGDGLQGPDELLWRSRIEEDLENLRAALRWSIDTGDVDAALTEVYALTPWSQGAPPFGMMALEAARMPGAAGHRFEGAALGTACAVLTVQGALVEALDLANAAEQATTQLGNSAEDRTARCRIGGCIITVIAYSGDNARIIRLAREKLADARAAGNRFETARALIMLTGTLGVEDADEAIRAGEEGLGIAREIGAPSYLAWAPMMLAGRLPARDPARAEALLEEAVAAAVRADNDWARTMAMQQLAVVRATQGDLAGAARAAFQMAEVAHLVGDHGSAQSGLAMAACLLAALGDEEGGLLVGAWVEGRGFRLRIDLPSYNPALAFTEIGTYVRLRDSRLPDEMRALEARAGALDEAAAVDYARSRVDAMPGFEVDVHRRTCS